MKKLHSLQKYLFSFLYTNSKKEFLLQNTIPGITKELHISQYTYPYEHYVIDNFLETDTAQSLYDHFIKKEEDSSSFSYLKLYDLYASKINHNDSSVTDIFCTHLYKNFIEKLFTLSLSPYHELCFHNNVADTGDKYIHTDHSYVLFSETKDPYFLGETILKRIPDSEALLEHDPSSLVKKRSVTMILYLNKDWKEGDGGETGIFKKTGASFEEITSISPIFNRIIFFKNNDHSFHNYKNCVLPSRKAMTQWLYE
jgi:hypothetical protein